MRVFSVRPHGIVLHAHVRFVGSDLQAVLLGRLVTGRIYAGALPPSTCAAATMQRAVDSSAPCACSTPIEDK